MRATKRAAIRRERICTAVISVLAGLGALTVSAAVLSAAAALCDMSGSAIRAMSGIALAAGCFACAFCTANRRRKKGLLSGIVCGAAVFCAAVLVGGLTVRAFSAGGVVIKLIIILTSSAIGGIKGVNTRPVFGN